MAGYYPKVGDKIEVSKDHRLRGEKGSIIAIGDNTTGQINHFHIYFDRSVWGTIGGREIWLGIMDFHITEKCADD